MALSSQRHFPTLAEETEEAGAATCRCRVSRQKRPRGSSLLSWGATHCSILKQQSASAAAMSSVTRSALRAAPAGKTPASIHGTRSMKGHYQRLAIPGPPGALPVPFMAHAAKRHETQDLRTCLHFGGLFHRSLTFTALLRFHSLLSSGGWLLS